MNPTRFQSKVQDLVRKGRSVLLVAPTGLGKTYAVTGDLETEFCKTVYAVPLRALGSGIRDAVAELKRNGNSLRPVIHHGDLQESELFGEEVIVTTYDQVVCGVPGLPLSLPLRAGHAVAGALLMSRLILDEAHLAWAISRDALSILLAIVDFRRKLGLQTILLTATLPRSVAKRLSEPDALDMALVVVGEDGFANDEGLQARNQNRHVTIAKLELKSKGKEAAKTLDTSGLDRRLVTPSGSKKIYFANTVERIQQTYDSLISQGVIPDKVTVLHNRMPKSWRQKAEKDVHARFGEGTSDGDWLLLTNQVAEVGLDISAPLVVSDPAPVDTLVQRAGRCGRWFRNAKTTGEFYVITVPKAQLKEWAIPYREAAVGATLKTCQWGNLSWANEQAWVNQAWGVSLNKQGKLTDNPEQEQSARLDEALASTVFALNLFDRAAQERKPGEIANTFREILSVEIAVGDTSTEDLLHKLSDGSRPETSSVSMGTAYRLIRQCPAKAVRWERDELQVQDAFYIRPGDMLIVPPRLAYLQTAKGLCIGDGSVVEGAILASKWNAPEQKGTTPRTQGKRQTLLEHTVAVMDGTYQRLKERGAYRDTLIKVLRSLEPDKNAENLADLIAELAKVAAALHDLGKADERWQQRAREIDSCCSSQLIGRTALTTRRMGIPHTPPCYAAVVHTCQMLLGKSNGATHLVRGLALAAARHHSSLLNPASVEYQFNPHSDAAQFIVALLETVNAPEPIRQRVNEIVEAAKTKPTADQVPLMLPNDDLFPVYALVGRAILLADREDAKGRPIEQWRITS